MIKVGEVRIKAGQGKVLIYCDFDQDGASTRLWFEVSEKYAEFVTTECGDAFFVALVMYAHLVEQDIEFLTPVSTRLYYGITEALLPALKIINPSKSLFHVDAPTRNFHFQPIATGTALSLGVDSFHALSSSLGTHYPVSHLTLFNSGAFGDFGGDKARKIFLQTAESVRLAARELHLPLIAVDSNISDILRVPFSKSHSIRNLAFALLFPKLFRTFFYASGYPVSDFRLDPSGTAAHYDLLVSKVFQTESLEILIAGLHDSRIDKIRAISSFPPTYRHLNVCVLAESNPFLLHSQGELQNCSRCFKCVKTMVALDVLGMLDSYSNVFDIDLYIRQRSYYLGWILYDAKKIRSAHAREIVQEASKRHDFFPPSSWAHAILRGTGNLCQKLKFNNRRSR